MSDIHDPAATDRDLSRPTATGIENDYTLPLDEVSERYAKAGHPRTIRSLQRYCAVGHLDCQKVATTIGDKYLVTSQSVARHIAQIEELHAFDIVATPVAPQQSSQTPPADHATELDEGRHTATGERATSRSVERLEREVEQAKDERDFLREQIDRKDKTIDSLIERDRETNILVRGLQEMLTPLLGGPRREPRVQDDAPSP